MAGLNDELLMVLGRLFRDREAATVVLDSGKAKRVLHVRAGALIAADSTILAERFGNLVVAAKGVDAPVVEAIAAEAKRNRSFLGDQLVEEGVLTTQDLASLLELQLRVRCQQSLWMPGIVDVQPLKSENPTGHFPIGRFIVSVFRDQIPIESLRALVLPHKSRVYAVSAVDDVVHVLGLLHEELAYLDVIRGHSLVQDVTVWPERVVRLFAALLALGLLETRRRA